MKSTPAQKLKRLNASRAALHKRRLKLDDQKVKARRKLELILAKQVIYADRYNSLVYRITQLKD